MPLFGSKPFTFCGTLRISSTRLPTLAIIGVLHEPTQSLFVIPSLPPGSLCSQTVLPEFLSTASRTWRSPGPTQRMARSPYRIGDEALPQRWIILLTSLRHSSLPSML